jgi:hydroxyacylglutathione hydrolase
MDILCLPVLSDNYTFVLHDPLTHQAAVVDPAIAEPVIDCLAQLGAELVWILHTHHHWDHIGGDRALLARFPNLAIYGGALDQERIPGLQKGLVAGDRVTVCGRTAAVLFVPGHTRAHIAYYFPGQDAEPGDLFCGDTLFAGGCGRLFEGTPQQMVASLGQLRQLPPDTCVWCAHEYTLKNLQFAITVDSANPVLQERLLLVTKMRDRKEPTIPTTIGLELATNPFFRWDDPALMATTKMNDSVRSFARLRGMKDQFS